WMTGGEAIEIVVDELRERHRRAGRSRFRSRPIARRRAEGAEEATAENAEHGEFFMSTRELCDLCGLRGCSPCGLRGCVCSARPHRSIHLTASYARRPAAAISTGSHRASGGY